MKLFDRYILGLFLKNYLISLGVLIGMYVVMDMVFEFDKIVVVDQTGANTGGGIATAIAAVHDVADYYFYQSFLIFTHLSGIIPVVAAAFTLMRLSRFNELTAFVAAGVPILVLTRWIFIASVLLNGLLIVDQELVLPQMIPKLVRKHDEMHASTATMYPIKTMQVGDGSLLGASLYHPPTATTPAYMEDFDVLILDRNDRLVTTDHIRASKAVYDPATQSWTLTDGFHVGNLLPEQKVTDENPVPTWTGVTPEQIALYRGSATVELLSLRRIYELIAQPKNYGTAGLYKIAHLRISQPILNVVLLALTVPFVLTYDAKRLKSAAGKCLTVLALAMGSVFICQQIAAHPPLGPTWVSLWPALMSWVPIFIFGPLSLWLLFERVRT